LVKARNKKIRKKSEDKKEKKFKVKHKNER
jgi:hypothetical protein